MKKKIIIDSEYDPQYQLDIEKLVLGSLLLNSEKIYEVANDFNANLFFDARNVAIAEAFIEMHVKNKKIELISLVEVLKRKHRFDESGGYSYISSLTERISSTANLEYHIRLLQQFFLTRFIGECCSEATRKLYEYRDDPFDIKETLKKKLDDIDKELIKTELAPIGQVHSSIIEKAYLLKNEGGFSGVPTGLDRLDLLTNGFQKSDLIIIAGRPSMGKTAFAVSILIEPAIVKKIPIAFFSLEMSKEQVVSRVQSILSEINVSKIVKKQLTELEIDHIDRRCVELLNSPLYIDDSANISILELKTKARKLVRETGVRMIVVDYLQLMRSGMKTFNREQEIAEISKGLKAIAKELDIPIIALSQLSRSVEQRGGDKKPSLSDLRDSGQIEQDADMVIFAHRPEYYGMQSYDWSGTELNSKGLFLAVVSKHRNGVLGEIPLTFYGELTKIDNHTDSNFLYSGQNNMGINRPITPHPQSSEFPKTDVSHTFGMPINYDFDIHKEGIDKPINLVEQKGTKKPNSDSDDFLNETPF
jgi:replicative DNA helicase